MQGFKFQGKITTDNQGFDQLARFYHKASKLRDQWFDLNFDSVSWIDANLSPILMAMVYKLRNPNNLSFFIDYHALHRDLNVLKRNGLARHIVHPKHKKRFPKSDERNSTIPFKAVNLNNVDEFVTYIESSFLKHRGLENVKHEHKNKLQESYCEIFNNAEIHANTTAPVIACGQYFPQEAELKFTLVDLGEGFLKKIAQHTKGNEAIQKPEDAISWAVKGGTTKPDAPGGNGLKKIMQYCWKNGGELHIVSDGCYWAFKNKSIDTSKLTHPFTGATIHLIFRYLNTG